MTFMILPLAYASLSWHNQSADFTKSVFSLGWFLMLFAPALFAATCLEADMRIFTNKTSVSVQQMLQNDTLSSHSTNKHLPCSVLLFTPRSFSLERKWIIKIITRILYAQATITLSILTSALILSRRKDAIFVTSVRATPVAGTCVISYRTERWHTMCSEAEISIMISTLV